MINSIVHHIGIGVTDVAKAERYYDSLLVDYLGMDKEKVWEANAGWKGRGTRIYIYHSEAVGEARNLQHLAFSARSREEVDSFFGWADARGIKILREPREYPEYGGDYFAVFFEGPDHLKLELVHLSEADGEEAL